MRHIAKLDRHPKLIVKDTHMAQQRRDLLQSYVLMNGTTLVDPLLVHTDPATEFFLNMKEEFRPPGFQEWRKWGAPPGAPGQSPHHPALKEHEFIGWLVVMHFLSALELVAAADDLAASSSNVVLNCPTTVDDGNKNNCFPPPLSVDTTNVTWSSMLYGSTVSSSDSRPDQWDLRPIHCRTSFEPILDGTLESIVIGGTSGDELDLMLPKGHYYYDKGWVMDLSDKEKLAKQKLNRFNGLGFVDSKKAYYGLYESGPLRLLLPYEPPREEGGAALPKIGDNAQEWFQSVVVCEVNEQRDVGECDVKHDVSYTVGGVKVSQPQMIDSAGTLYVGKKLCMYLEVPDGAKITSRKTMEEDPSFSNTTLKLLDLPDAIGVSLDIQVTNKHIYNEKNACSVSHVVWEQMKVSP